MHGENKIVALYNGTPCGTFNYNVVYTIEPNIVPIVAVSLVAAAVVVYVLWKYLIL